MKGYFFFSSLKYYSINHRLKFVGLKGVFTNTVLRKISPAIKKEYL